MIFVFTAFQLSSQLTLGAQPVQVVDFRGVAKEAIPAVVSIKVKGKATDNPWGDDEDDRNPFGGGFFQFFRPKQPQVEMGQASGFLVSPDGYIVTNHHVVDGVDEIKVTLNDGKEYTGKVIGDDQTTDIAVIKIDGEGTQFPYLKFGNSDQLEVAQWVGAVGTPFGLQASFTVGVVSAKGRNNLDLVKVEDFIQTDAAINLGNSGGPLITMDGEVIGINTAIATQLGSRGYLGIGFAIPSNIAKVVYEQLVKTGSIERGYLGVQYQKIDQDMAHALNLKRPEGVLVAEVFKGSPADAGGVKQGDIILKYDDKPLDNLGSFRNYVALTKPGTKLTLTILRDGKTTPLIVTVGSYKEGSEERSQQTYSSLGIQVDNSPNQEGVLITQVDPKSPSALVLKKGALILAVNRTKIQSVHEFYKALDEADKSRPILLLVKQGNINQYISIKIN